MASSSSNIRSYRLEPLESRVLLSADGLAALPEVEPGQSSDAVIEETFSRPDIDVLSDALDASTGSLPPMDWLDPVADLGEALPVDSSAPGPNDPQEGSAGIDAGELSVPVADDPPGAVSAAAEEVVVSDPGLGIAHVSGESDTDSDSDSDSGGVSVEMAVRQGGGPDRPLLIVPGIGGTFAADGFAQDWLIERGMHPDLLVDDPFLGIYSDLASTLENYGYLRDSNLFVANYDWRVPIAPDDGVFDGEITGITSAQLGADVPAANFQYAVNYLAFWMDRAVDEWKADHGGIAPDGVDLIAHSTGGIVSRAYIQSAAHGVSSGSVDLPEVKRFIMAGVPNRGAPKAFSIWQDDWSVDPAFKILFHTMVSNAYALHQAGTTITGPDGDIPPDPGLDGEAFLRRYVALGRGLLPTMPFLLDSASDHINADTEIRNHVVLDINDGLDLDYALEDAWGSRDPNGFVDDLLEVHVVYGADLNTPTTVVEHAFGKLHDSVLGLAGWETALGRTPYYQLTHVEASGDGTVPTVSAAGQFEADDSVWEKGVTGWQVPNASHTDVVNGKAAQYAILLALDKTVGGIEDVRLVAADPKIADLLNLEIVSGNVSFSAQWSALRAAGLTVTQIGGLGAGSHGISLATPPDQVAISTGDGLVLDWIEQGPVAFESSRSVATTNTPYVSGAVNAVLLDQYNYDDTTNKVPVFLGSVNGGVWWTDDIIADDRSGEPDWVPLTDDLPSLSVTAMIANDDGSSVYIATGLTSSAANRGRTGGIYKLNAETFEITRFAGGLLESLSILDLAFLGGADEALLAGTGDGTMYRITAAGDLDEVDVPGMTRGFNVVDLARDPADPTVILAGIIDADGPPMPEVSGVYRSDDSGASWSPVVTGGASTTLTNIQIDFGTGGVVYAGLVARDSADKDRLASVVRSEDSGENWSVLTGLPLAGAASLSAGERGLHPGGQGELHFALIVDPQDPDVLYVGGDRQPSDDPAENEIGLSGWNGRVFRGVVQNPGTAAAWIDWTQIVGDNAGGTAPHADTRGFLFLDDYVNVDVGGGATEPHDVLLVVDDGGIFYMEDPESASRTWESRNANLRVTEVRTAAFDSLHGVMLSGQQDNGTTFQIGLVDGVDNDGDTATEADGDSDERFYWTQVLSGDGNSNAVVAFGSDRYAYYVGNNLNWVRRLTIESDGPDLGTRLDVGKTGLLADDAQFEEFTTVPFEVGKVTATQHEIAIGLYGLYLLKITESGGTWSSEYMPVGPSPNHQTFSAIDYVDNGKSHALYAARGNEVFYAFGTLSKGVRMQSTKITNAGTILDLIIDPGNQQVAYALDGDSVFVTRDGGKAWAEISTNLRRMDWQLSAMELIKSTSGDMLLVAARKGIWQTFDPALQETSWRLLQGNMANALVSDLDYDVGSDTLVVGTLGRGVWSLADAAQQLAFSEELHIRGTSGPDVIELIRQEENRELIEVYVDGILEATESLKQFLSIHVEAGEGNDTITVHSDFGAISVPNGIFIDGGDDVDEVALSGPAPVAKATDEFRIEDGEFILYDEYGEQWVFVDQVEIETDLLDDALPFEGLFGAGVSDFSDRSSDLSGSGGLGGELPGLGGSTGKALSGARTTNVADKLDPGSDVQAPINVLSNAGTTLFDQVWKSEGGSVLDEIAGAGSAADIDSILQDWIDGDGAVVLTETPTDTRFDIFATKQLGGTAVLDFDLDALGARIDLSGFLDIAADITIRLTLGVDSLGFYIQPDAANPEVTMSNVTVDGTVDATGTFGFLGVVLTGASLTLDSGVAVEIEMTDPETHTADGKIRPFELGDEGWMSSQLVSGGRGEDFVFQFTIGLAGFGADDAEPFSLGNVEIELKFGDVTNPLSVQVTAVPMSDGGNLLDFLLLDAEEMLFNLKQWADWLAIYRDSDYFDQEIPFSSGATLGETFDFALEFIDTVYNRLFDTSVVSNSAAITEGDALESGRLLNDATFSLTLGGEDPVTVTVAAADTDDNEGPSDLFDDIQAAIDAEASLEGRVTVTTVQGLMAFVLESGAASSLTLSASGSDNGIVVELGFGSQATGFQTPAFPTFQELLDQLLAILDPGGTGAVDLEPAFDEVEKELTFRLTLSGGEDFAADFSVDEDMDLGPLADVDASGSLEGTLGWEAGALFGFDLSAEIVPRLATSYVIPPPSDGRIQGDAEFRLKINGAESDLIQLSAGNYLTLDGLRTELNSVLAGRMWEGQDLSTLVAFQTATDDPLIDGNTMLLVALETQLGVVTTIEVVAESDLDPIFAEVGFVPSVAARTTIDGFFLDDVTVKGTLTFDEASANLGLRFGVLDLAATASLVNEEAGDNELAVCLDIGDRLEIAELFDGLEAMDSGDDTGGGLFDLTFDGTVRLELEVDVAGLDLYWPGLPADGIQFGIFIPDIRDLTFNENPFDPLDPEASLGIFIEFPELAGFENFKKLSFIDIVLAIDAIVDQLEGVSSFGFLGEDLPVLNASISDLVDMAGEMAALADQLRSADGESIAELEAAIEDFFQVSNPNTISLAVEDNPFPSSIGPGETVVFAPTGYHNDLSLTHGGSDTLTLALLDEGTFGSGADAATVTYDAAVETLTILYNSAYTTAATLRREINAAGSPLTVELEDPDSADGSVANDGSGVVHTTAILFNIHYELNYGESLPLAIDLAELVSMLPGGDAARDLLEGVTDFVDVSGSGSLDIHATASVDLVFGIDLSNPCGWAPFLHQDTRLTLEAEVLGSDIEINAALGTVGVFVRNGTATIDADGDPDTSGAAEFTLGLIELEGDGRFYLRDVGDWLDLDHLDIGMTLGVSTELPIFYPTEDISLSGTDDLDGDGFPDNHLVIEIGSLSALLGGDSAQLSIHTPDLGFLLSDLNICNIVQHSPLLLDGLDLALGLLQDGLESEVFSNPLPLVGTRLGDAADVIGDFREGMLGNLRDRLAAAGDPFGLVQEALFDSLGPGGLNMLALVNEAGALVDENGSLVGDPVLISSPDDIVILCDGERLDIRTRLVQEVLLVDTTANPIDLNLGVDALGLEIDGSVQVAFGFDFKLFFGLNLSDGFFLDTSDSEELIIDLEVTTPGLEATGSLLFLELQVSDEDDGLDLTGKPRDESSFTGAFTIDLGEPSGDDLLTLSDMISPGLDLGEIIQPNLEAVADVNLDLIVSFGSDAVFPSLVVEFDLDWEWQPGDAIDGGDLSVTFNNLSLDLGVFISDFLMPIFEKIRVYTEPLQPVVDILTFKLPVISDLAEGKVTLLDIATGLGYVKPSTAKFIEALATVVDIVNSIPVGTETLLIPLGGFELQRDARGDFTRVIDFVNSAEIDLSAQVEGSSEVSSNFKEEAGEFVEKLDSLENFNIPFLTRPSEIFNLFLGLPVTLLEWHLPVLDFSFSYTQKFPIFPPLFAHFTGELGAIIDLTVGFDTFGLQVYNASQDKDVADIFQGFFIKDTDSSGQESAELTLHGGIAAGASISLLAAEAGVQGGLFATIEFDLRDPNDDGKIRLQELVENGREDPRCIFDMHGELVIGLEAFLRAKILGIKIDKTWRFAEILLLEFDLACPEPQLATFPDDATGESRNGEGTDGVLRLNMGPHADARAHGDTVDGNETYLVEHISGDENSGATLKITFNGLEQEYVGVKSLWADGGGGNDVIDLRGLELPYQIKGGSGNDTLYAGDYPTAVLSGDTLVADTFDSRDAGVYGDGGDDVLVGAGFGDYLSGGDGQDDLTGEDGDDALIGGANNDEIDGGDGDDQLDGGDGADLLFGRDGDDTIDGGGGNDEIWGAAGEDVVDAGSGNDEVDGGLDDDWLVGGTGDDVVHGQGGDDVILGDTGTIVGPLEVSQVGGAGNDVISGGPGSDIIFAGGGNDAVFGGTLQESGSTTAIETDSYDFIDSGDGDDVVVADNGHGDLQDSFAGASVRGVVWLDADPPTADLPNGLFDEDESVLAGVLVELFDVDSGIRLMSVRSDSNGEYQFAALPAGAYYVQFTALTDLEFTDPDAGGDDAEVVDSDVDVDGKTVEFDLDAGENDTEFHAGLKSAVPETEPIVTVEDVSIHEGDTGVTDLEFLIQLSLPSTEIVTVAYRTIEDPAAAVLDRALVDSDLVYSSWTLVFEPGITTLPVTVPIVGDVIHETDETFLLELTGAFRATLGDTEAVGTIINDDDVPQVTVGDGILPIVVDDGVLTSDEIFAEQGGRLEFPIRLSRPSSQEIRVPWETALWLDDAGEPLEETALPGLLRDFRSAFGTVRFLPGEIEHRVIVRIQNDGLNEADERFQVVIDLDADQGADLAEIVDGAGVGVILGSYTHEDGTLEYDDPLPEIWFRLAGTSLSEQHIGSTIRHHSIRMSGPSGRDIQVHFGTAPGTATDLAEEGGVPDFVQASDRIVIPAGETSALIPFEVNGDVENEPHEYFFLNLLSAENATIRDNRALVTIIDDDPSGATDLGPWFVQFAAEAFEVSEDGGEAEITLLRVANSSEPVAVYWTLGGTADPGLDYEAIDPRRIIRFDPWQTLKTFSIPIVDDDSVEANETVELWLSNPTGGNVKGLIDRATLTILDNDALPEILVEHVTVTEGDPADTVEVVFEVNLSFAIDREVTLDFVTSGFTATEGTDYTASSGTLTFPADSVAPQEIRVSVIPDEDPEFGERFYVNFSNVTNALLEESSVQGTIEDDDELEQIIGFLFRDLNQNGFYDESTESGIWAVGVDYTDSSGVTESVVSDVSGFFYIDALVGDVLVEVDRVGIEIWLPGAELTTGNDPVTVQLTPDTVVLDPIGYYPAPQTDVPPSSTGNSGGFYDDTVYGGAGDDELRGGGGNDHLIGGHWIGPAGAGQGDPYDAALLDIGDRVMLDPNSLPARGEIGDKVWLDADGDGENEILEGGVGGIEVRLFDEHYSLIGITFTDLTGRYLFDELVLDVGYYVQVILPPGFTFTAKDSGRDISDSDVDPETGLTDLFTLTTASDLTLDAGLVEVPDPDPNLPWNLQFAQAIYSVSESDGQVLVDILRTADSPEGVGAFFTSETDPIESDSALAELDFASATATVRMGEGETSFAVGVEVFEDSLEEGFERAYLVLLNPAGGPVNGNLSQAVLLIFDEPNPDDDVLRGGTGADLLIGDYGYVESDGETARLLGGLGNDTLRGGEDDDEIRAQGGNDLLVGGKGDDFLDGSGGNDLYLYNGDEPAGTDEILEVTDPFGGNDTLDFGSTTLPVTLDLGGATTQTVTAEVTLVLPADPVIENVTGGLGNDFLSGNDLDNILIGGDGADVLEGFGGDDELLGGRGGDTYLFDADLDLGHNRVEENESDPGDDRFDFSQTTLVGVTVDLSLDHAQAVTANSGLTLETGSAIEMLLGGDQADVLTGNDLNNVIGGGGGDDELDGGAGTDRLKEDRAGNFQLTSTTLTFNGVETDTYSNFEDVHLVGDDTDNSLDASSFSGVVILEGGGGDDELIGGSGTNLLIGGPGEDTLDGSLGYDVVVEERDADFLLTDGLFEVDGEADVIIGFLESFVLTGGEGNNILDARGYSGSVSLEGAGGDDDLIGGTGFNTYLFDADTPLGSDRVDASAGGEDTIDFTETEVLGVQMHLNPGVGQTVNANLQLLLIGRIENLFGGQSDDLLIGNNLANVLGGQGGHDHISGSGGDDDADGGDGVDTYEVRRNADILLTDNGLGVDVEVGAFELDTVSGFERFVVVGGDGDNLLDASDLIDVETELFGGAGDDELRGSGGNDVLTGGKGNDALIGGPGDDVYRFDADQVEGDDRIEENPGEGTDRLDFSATHSTGIQINLGATVPQRVAGSLLSPRLRITLSDGETIEEVVATDQNDRVSGNSLDNVLITMGGDDELDGVRGDDWLEGGAGNDVYVFPNHGSFRYGLKTIFELPGESQGVDTLDFSDHNQAVSVNLARMDSQSSGRVSLLLAAAHSIENVIGSALNDNLVGNDLDNRFEPGAGADNASGLRGDDTYAFNTDTFIGDAVLWEVPDEVFGNDTVDFSDTLGGPIFLDLGVNGFQSMPNLRVRLRTASPLVIGGFENVVGGGGNDTLTGNHFDNVMIGGGGNDILRGGSGDDTLVGGGGDDTLEGEIGNDTYVFNADRMLGADAVIEDNDEVVGGRDVLDFSPTATSGLTVELGSLAAQPVTPTLTLTLSGRTAIEEIIGGAGHDRISGNASNNVLTGGPGNDVYLYDLDLGDHGSDLIVENPDPAEGGDDDVLDFTATLQDVTRPDLFSPGPQPIDYGMPDSIRLILSLSAAGSVERLEGSFFPVGLAGIDGTWDPLPDGVRRSGWPWEPGNDLNDLDDLEDRDPPGGLDA